MFVASLFDDITSDIISGDQTSRASLSIAYRLSASPIGLLTSFIMFEKQKPFVLDVINWFIIWNDRKILAKKILNQKLYQLI